MRFFSGGSALARSRIAWLEGRFVVELKVASDIFGCSSTEWRLWAEEALAGSAYIPQYLAAWKVGKREAWRRLNTLAEHLRDAAGDDQDAFEARLTRLETAARTQTRVVQPVWRSGMQLGRTRKSPAGRPRWNCKRIRSWREAPPPLVGLAPAGPTRECVPPCPRQPPPLAASVQ